MNKLPVHVIGLGMSPGDLTPRMLVIIRAAQVLAGGSRLLQYFPDHPGEKVVLGKDIAAALARLAELAVTKNVVVLASGDPNFYGVGPRLVALLGAENVVIHPNITAVQAACARVRMAWQDARIISLHGRTWEPLAEALEVLSQSSFILSPLPPGGEWVRVRGGTARTSSDKHEQIGKLLIYTDPEHSPAAIARFLLARGWGQARLCVLEDLGQPGERVSWLSPEEANKREFSPLNLVLVLPEPYAGDDAPAGRAAPALRLGLPEEAFTHQAGLITKAEVRAVALAKLELQRGLVLWDVGAGCGSVGLEASLLLPGGKIFAVEQDQERAGQIRANAQKFGVGHLEVVCGRAPECLEGLPAPQRAFIGGGGRDLAEILRVVLARLEPGGKVVAAAALLETLDTARTVLAEAGWPAEVVQLQVSRSRPLAGGAYLQALNPVWLISGSRG